ncbi:MAG: UbiA family prenyltransferase [Chitinophagaceae bacterium]|nr:UbiA family prenyltransferase [Chitinophagaceae bacterium]
MNNYLSLVKFSHTIFAMPFALIGFFLGLHFFRNSYPTNQLIIKFFLVILCMVFARSAAMAFNRYLDRKYDEQNPRTAIREIPKGIITERNALVFVIFNCIAFIICTYFINSICLFLSPVALFVVLFYSYTKRFTALCHLVLGLGLSLAPIGAYLAVTGKFNLLPVLFSFTVLFWVSGFDIMYALQDEAFDKANNLYSIPAVLGKTKALGISILLHVFSAACVVAAGVYGNFGWIYWMGVCFFILLLVYQHTLVTPNNLSKVNLAFFTTNGIASVIFCIFVLLDLFLIK